MHKSEERLVLGVLIVITQWTMIFPSGSFAQDRTLYRQEIVSGPCLPGNPRYCQECKDADKRDFAKCGEIDYRTMDLMKSGLLPGSPPYLPPDRENDGRRVVFAANIGIKDLRSEIFVVNSDNPARTQKRLTWDADTSQVNLDPFFTVDHKIAYTRVDTLNKTEKYFVIEDVQSGKKTEITREQSDSLYLAAHQNPGKK